MSKVKSVLLYFVSFCVFYTNQARILSICPYPSYSHQLIHTVIVKELSLRGHQVVQFTVHPLRDKKLTNLTEIDISYLFKYVPKYNYENSYKVPRLIILYLQNMGLKQVSEDFLGHSEFQKIINNDEEKFDLVLIESGVSPIFSSLGERFNCPVIAIRSVALRLQNHDSIGNPTNPAYIHIGHYENVENEFLKRVDNFIYGVLHRMFFYAFTIPEANKQSKMYFPKNVILPWEATKNISLVLANTHPVLSRVRPLVPSHVEIGGIHLTEVAKHLPPDLESFVEKSKKGVIFVSLGSTANGSKISERFIDVLNYTFRNVPYNVLWKWNGPSYNLSSNVKISHWISQQAILDHPKTKLFITHAGFLSFLETVHHRVPVVAVPLFADQFTNARRMKKLKIGLMIDLKTVTKDFFLKSVNQVLDNPMYTKNIIKISQIIDENPIKPMDKAMWWIEYVLRHKGAPYFRSKAVDLNWIQYLLIDVYLFLLCTLYLSFIVFKYVLKFIKLLFSRLKCKKKMMTKKTN